MKKLISILAFAVAGQAMAIEVTAERDFTADKNVVSVAQTVRGIDLGVSHAVDTYTRVSAGTTQELVKVGPVALRANTHVAYQDATVGKNGFGVGFGVSANYRLAKQVELGLGYNRFVAEDKLKQWTGNYVAAGVTYKF